MATNIYLTTNVATAVTLTVASYGPDAAWDGYVCLTQQTAPSVANQQYIGYVTRSPGGMFNHTGMFEVQMSVGNAWVGALQVMLGASGGLFNEIEWAWRLPTPEIGALTGDHDPHYGTAIVDGVVYTLTVEGAAAAGADDIYVTLIGHTATPDWMADLARGIGNVPLRKVLLPGTHDSGTATMNASSTIVSSDPITGWLAKLFGEAGEEILPMVAWRFARTQALDIATQLTAGVRYFDLRVWLDPAGRYQLVHALTGECLNDVLPQVRGFLDAHPGEVVILDVQHLIDFPDAQAVADLVAFIHATLGTRLAPRDFGRDVTLNQLLHDQDRRQVIMPFKYDDQFVSSYPDLWYRANAATSCLASPYRSVNTSAGLTARMRELARVDYRKFFVLQAVLTFAWTDIRSALSLEGFVVPATQALVRDSLRDLAQLGNLNVVMVDFFEQTDLVGKCIDLNQELHP
jgi:hypothetical protein